DRPSRRNVVCLRKDGHWRQEVHDASCRSRAAVRGMLRAATLFATPPQRLAEVPDSGIPLGVAEANDYRSEANDYRLSIDYRLAAAREMRRSVVRCRRLARPDTSKEHVDEYGSVLPRRSPCRKSTKRPIHTRSNTFLIMPVPVSLDVATRSVSG